MRGFGLFALWWELLVFVRKRILYLMTTFRTSGRFSYYYWYPQRPADVRFSLNQP